MVGDWQLAETLLRKYEHNETPQHAIAKALLAMRQTDNPSFDQAMQSASMALGASLVGAGKGAFRRAYESLAHLHMLEELSIIRTSMISIEESNDVSAQQAQLVRLREVLDARLASTMPSFRRREQIISLRRSAFDLR